MQLCVIDFETANDHPESACSIGIVVFEDGILIHQDAFLIKPASKYDYFTEMNISIHGIRPSDVEDAPNFSESYDRLRPWFNTCILAAHFAPFDLSVLKSLYKYYALAKPLTFCIDSVELSRKCFPRLVNHKLNTVCEYLDIPLNHHDALSDALGSALIFMNVMAINNEYDILALIKRYNLKTYHL